MSPHALWEFSSDPDRATVFRVRRVQRNGWEDPQPPPVLEVRAPFRLSLDWNRWSPQRRGPARLPAGAAEWIGEALFAALPDELKSDRGWIEIAPVPERLIDTPWECLRAASLPLGGDDVRLTRSVPVRYRIPPKMASPIRVFLVVTNPKDERLLQADRELHALAPEGIPDYDVHRHQEPTFDSLRAALEEHQPHVVHYVGHAASSSGQGHLILHDFDGNTRWLSAAELASLLPASVGLLCLSTCFTAENYDVRGLSRLAHAAPELSLPSVVFNQLPLGLESEATVQAYWHEFYAELSKKGSAIEAHDRGRRAALAAGGPFEDWVSFGLVVRDGTGQPFEVGEITVDPERVVAEFNAALSLRIANSLTSVTLPPGLPGLADVGKTFESVSRKELENAKVTLRRFGGFPWEKP